MLPNTNKASGYTTKHLSGEKNQIKPNQGKTDKNKNKRSNKILTPLVITMAICIEQTSNSNTINSSIFYPLESMKTHKHLKMLRRRM